MIELRVLAPGDWMIWRESRLAALAEAPEAFGARLADWQGDGDREERWRARLEVPGSYHLVALLDGAPAGMVSGMPTSDERTAELVSMWVAPMARGRGVGRALLSGVEQWARQEAAAQVLRLCVVDDNHAASALYQRYGFVFTADPGELMSDGVRRERVMVKTLADRTGAQPPPE